MAELTHPVSTRTHNALKMPEITPEDIQHTEKLIGLKMTDDERELMLNGLKDLLQGYEAMRRVPLPNDLPPAIRFDPTIAIIQGGAPTTNSWSDPGPGYTIPDEGGQFIKLSSGGLRGPFSYRAGDLVMARSAGPDSSGAQFFFATGPEVSLLDNQGTYLVFGHADEAGIAVLQAMMDLYELDDTSPYGGGPIRDVVVRSITIELG
jgi:cyclophilin family peptidyl-prolyl cis-trans isomerase